MKKIMHIALLACFVLPWYANAPRAQQDDGIELTVHAWQEQVVTNAKGERETRRIELATVVPGDTVIYTISYINRGAKPAENVVINNPIPNHMVYIDGSAIGQRTAITFSVDGGKRYDAPKALAIPGENGVPRAARPNDFTNIRWTLSDSVSPKTEGFVEYRAVLE